jgi:hypothetical protein
MFRIILKNIKRISGFRLYVFNVFFSLWGFASCCVCSLNHYKYRLMRLLFTTCLYSFFLSLRVSVFSTIIRRYIQLSRKLSNCTTDPLFLAAHYLFYYALFLIFSLFNQLSHHNIYFLYSKTLSLCFWTCSNFFIECAILWDIWRWDDKLFHDNILVNMIKY